MDLFKFRTSKADDLVFMSLSTQIHLVVFSAILYKGDIFFDFLFTFLYTKSLLKEGM